MIVKDLFGIYFNAQKVQIWVKTKKEIKGEIINQFKFQEETTISGVKEMIGIHNQQCKIQLYAPLRHNPQELCLKLFIG